MSEHPVWPLWRRLTRLFPVWSIAFSAVASPGASRVGGVDYLGPLRRGRATQRAFELTSPLSDAEFDGLAALAALNARRQERLFRSIFVLYATVPITLLATSGELAPDRVTGFIREEWGLMAFYAVLFTVVLVWYYASLWRARQIVDVLDMARVERGTRPFTAVELRED